MRQNVFLPTIVFTAAVASVTAMPVTASAQQAAIVVEVHDEALRETVTTAARAAAVASGRRLVDQEQLDGAIAFNRSGPSLTDAEAVAIREVLHLDLLIVIRSRASDQGGVYFAALFYAPSDSPRSAYAHSAQGAESETVAALIANQIHVSAAPTEVDTGGDQPSPPGSVSPTPNGAATVPPSSTVDFNVSVHNRGSSDVCRIRLVQRGRVLSEDLLGGQPIPARESRMLSVPQPSGHELHAYSCTGQRLAWTHIGNRTTEWSFDYRALGMFPFSLALGIEAGGVYANYLGTSLGMTGFVPTGTVVFGFALEPDGNGIGLLARLGAVIGGYPGVGTWRPQFDGTVLLGWHNAGGLLGVGATFTSGGAPDDWLQGGASFALGGWSIAARFSNEVFLTLGGVMHVGSAYRTDPPSSAPRHWQPVDFSVGAQAFVGLAFGVL